MRPFYIALLGFGTVGQAVWDAIQTNRPHAAANGARQIVIKRILVRDTNKDYRRADAKMLLTDDYQTILKDADIDVVVALTGADRAALNYMIAALQAGKHVVTANKAVVAKYSEQLFAVARQQGRACYFEASVAAAIPIIGLLRDGLAANQIDSCDGILNGTSNYILSQMAHNQMSYQTALCKAQQLGYAEANPVGDVDGDDAANKLAIVGSLMFKQIIHPQTIARQSIATVEIVDIEAARAFGYVIKPIATAKRTDAELALAVYPALLPLDHPLGQVDDSFNALSIVGDLADKMTFIGRGAGGSATASAVLADLLSIARHGEHLPQGANYPVASVSLPICSPLQRAGTFYLRLDRHAASCFADICRSAGVALLKSATENDLVALVYCTDYGDLTTVLAELKRRDLAVHNCFITCCSSRLIDF